VTAPASAGPASTRQRVREVLAQRGFRHLVATRFVSQLGDGIFQLSAAKLLLFDHPGRNPALTLTALVAITLVPFSAIVPFVGVFIDRWDRRTILVYTPAIRAGLAALLPLTILHGESTPAFYGVALLVLSANRLFLATTSAVLPRLVPAEDLLIANSVASTGGSIASVTGLGLGAAAAAATGGSNAAVVAGFAFAGAALLARRIPVGRDRRRRRDALRRAIVAVARELNEGARQLIAARRIRYALSAVAAGQFMVGVMTGATAVAFIARLHLGVGAVTTLLGAIGAGLGVGVALVPLVARRVREDFIIPIAFAIGAVGAFTAAPLTRTSMNVAGVIVGLSYAFAKIPVDTIVQEEMPDAFRGRAFAVYDMIFNLARVAGTGAAAAAVAANVRPGTIVSVGGLCYVFASAILFVWARRIVGMRIPRRKARKESPATDAGGAGIVIPAGEMVTVRAYAGSRADEEPRAVVVGGREVPVEEVEWRAVQERDGERRRVFVVRLAGKRVRLAHVESTSLWEIERVLGASESGGT
jgi:predicted MFS family arabinose efflux permease